MCELQNGTVLFAPVICRLDHLTVHWPSLLPRPARAKGMRLRSRE